MGKWQTYVALGLASILFAVNCEDDKQDAEYFNASEWEYLKTLSPLPALPKNPTNKYADDPDAAVLGQALFWERRFQVAPLRIGKTTIDPAYQAQDPDAVPNPTALGEVGDIGKVSCASCHEPANWFNDNHSEPNNLTIAMTWSFRNDPSLVNVVFYDFLGWSGSGEYPWTQAAANPETAQGATRLGVDHFIYEHYKNEYEKIFGPLPEGLNVNAPNAADFPAQARPPLGFEKGRSLSPLVQGWVNAWKGMTAENQDIANRVYVNGSKAMEAYMRLLISRNAPFDRYVAGDLNAISTGAKRGLKIFLGKGGCVACHAGPFFTDHLYHAIGVPNLGPNVNKNDNGRYGTLKSFQNLVHLLNNPDPAMTGGDSFSGAGAYSDDPAAGLKHLQNGRAIGTAADLTTPDPDPSEMGKFRTKTLRHIDKTAPYMHDGYFADLPAVVSFYNAGGGDVANKDPALRPLGLSQQEQGDLVDFLKTLTGEPIPEALIKDTTAP